MANVTFKFNGKHALVTGAGQGIGRAIAKALSEAGAVTFALSKTQAHLNSLIEECPSIHAVCVDLADWSATQQAIHAVGSIDLLVNCAGVAMLQSFLDVDPNCFDKTFNVNVKAVIAVSQIVARGMIDNKIQGSIVNISSQASVRALQDHAVYCASKGALDQLTRVMALELGPSQIRVNSVNPTVVLTELGKKAWSDPSRGAPMKARIPLGRFADEVDVVNAVLYLLSDGASMIHGSFLTVDGGFTVA